MPVACRPFQNLSRQIRAFATARGGNIALTFALAIVPVVGLVGAAVDYSRANNIRTSLQSAVDSAVLMVSHEASTLTADQVTQKATSYVNAMFTKADLSGMTINAQYSADSGSGASVTLTASGTMATTFLNVIGRSSLPINVQSKSSWGNIKLRVAVALDVSGSQADAGKLTAMKSATKSLIDQLSALAKNPGDVMISLVPFAKVVKVGVSNSNATWLSYSYWDATAQTCTYSRWGSSCTAKPRTSWTGCVTDRQESYDVDDTAPTNASTYFPATDYFENGYYYCDGTSSVQLQPITALSYNWQPLKNAVDALQATGGTNQQIGIAWAWWTLKQGNPMNAPALDASFSYRHAIIVLSDGLNTENRIYGNGTAYAAQVDARQKLLCDNIKAKGITIYAIQVNTTGDPKADALSYCASGAENFFYLTSASQVLTAFDTIGASLSRLRIAQ